MDKKYVKHIIEDGARFHVTRYVLYKDKAYVPCSEPNCENNREWDNREEQTND